MNKNIYTVYHSPAVQVLKLFVPTPTVKSFIFQFHLAIFKSVINNEKVQD